MCANGVRIVALSGVFSAIRSAIMGGEKDSAEKIDDSMVPTETDYSNRNVMVGVVKSEHQFKVLVREKFYHIPMSQVNNCQFPVKYVAIYQSKRFFGKNAGIKIFGEVKSAATVCRNEILEIPKDSSEKYLYIKIKRWYRLKKDIEAKDMDGAAFSTSRYLLNNAHDSAELMIRSSEEHLFYKRLVGEVKSIMKNKGKDAREIVYRDHTVKLMGGAVYLYYVDVLECVINYEKFLERPMDLIKTVFDYYPEVQG